LVKQLHITTLLGCHQATRLKHAAFYKNATALIIIIIIIINSSYAGVARMGEGRGVYRILVEKPEGKRPLGRPRRR
jgi:hypothetical protein